MRRFFLHLCFNAFLLISTVLFFLSLTTCSLTDTTQQIEASLKLYFIDENSKYEISFIQRTVRVEDLSDFSNIPEKPAIKAVHFVSALTKGGTEMKIYIYTGIDNEKGVKHIIIDSNGNRDFSDDEQYSFPLDYYNEIHSYKDAEEYYIINMLDMMIDGEKLHVPIKIYQYRTRNEPKLYSTNDDYLLDFLPTTCFFYRDTVKINNTNIVVTWADNNIIPRGVNERQDFSFYNAERQIGYAENYILGDTLRIAYRKLKLDKLENNLLYINDLGASIDSCYVGDHLPQLFVNSLEDDSKLLLNEKLQGKYVFIDFWGSWCGPCVAAFPKLVEMSNTVKNRDDVIIVGIAVESSQSDIQKVKDIVHEHGVWWPNFWQERSNRLMQSFESPAGKLRVCGYPSYIVADKNGQILFTSIDTSTPSNTAVDFFLNLITSEYSLSSICPVRCYRLWPTCL